VYVLTPPLTPHREEASCVGWILEELPIEIYDEHEHDNRVLEIRKTLIS
jgi:hypothetical protein